MSIAKPTLSDIWANAAPAGDTGIADPGGLKDTGWTAASACPPFSWMNWILNKCDSGLRYLLARGIPDWDAAESYSVGDRVQGSDGVTYVAIATSGAPGAGENPGIGGRTKWAPWAHGVPAYRSDATYYLNDVVFAPSDGASYVCILANGPGSPKEPHVSTAYWKLWGLTYDDVNMLLPAIVVSQDAVGIAVAIVGTTGSATDALFTTVGYAYASKRGTFKLNTGSGGSVCTITFSGTKAFSSGIKTVQVTGTQNIGVRAANASATISSANVIVVNCDLGGGTYFVTVEGY